MLSIVATPIGNLKDLSLRAIEVLKAADVIVCEDTRHTGKLLEHFEIRPPKLLSFHEHSGPGRVREIVTLLQEGKRVALVSDAGSPLISDPGFPLLREVIREKLPVEVIPGPSAVTAALSVSGLPTERFTFWGFLPAKSGQRRRELEAATNLEHTVVFFETPHRIAKVLQEMAEICGEREAALCRELTKKFEEVSRGTLKELAEMFGKRKPLGEMVIVVAGKGRKRIFE